MNDDRIIGRITGCLLLGKIKLDYSYFNPTILVGFKN